MSFIIKHQSSKNTEREKEDGEIKLKFRP